MPNIGPLEIAIVLIVLVVIFGPRRLPAVGRSLGRGVRQLRSAVSFDDEPDPAERAPTAADDAPAADGKSGA